jgi:hypothetical protein
VDRLITWGLGIQSQLLPVCMVRDGTARTAGLTRYDHDEAIRTSGINGEDLTKNWPKSCLNQGSIRGKSGLKVDKTRNMKKRLPGR